MYNCKKQEAVINVIPTYRYLGYDTIKVETTFEMDEPFPDSEVVFVPSNKRIPSSIVNLINEHGFDFGPKLSSDVNKKLSDFGQEYIDVNRTEETRQDATLGLLITYMDNIQLKPVSDGSNFYNLSYQYNLYPDKDGNFDFRTILPLAGLQDAGNIEVQLFIVLPQGVTFDPTETKGISVNGAEIEEKSFSTENGRNIITFYYKQDPNFFVRYKYN